MESSFFIITLIVLIIILIVFIKCMLWKEFPDDRIFIELINTEGENYKFDSRNSELIYGYGSFEKYYKTKNGKFIRVRIYDTGTFDVHQIKEIDFKEHLITHNYKAYEKIFNEKFKTI